MKLPHTKREYYEFIKTLVHYGDDEIIISSIETFGPKLKGMFFKEFENCTNLRLYQLFQWLGRQFGDNYIIEMLENYNVSDTLKKLEKLHLHANVSFFRDIFTKSIEEDSLETIVANTIRCAMILHSPRDFGLVVL